MLERIQLEDLPPRQGADDQTAWVLTWRAGDRCASLGLPDGESIVGSSSGSHVRLNAPGVAARHFRIKRDDWRLFVQPLGRARLRLDGNPVKELTPFNAGQELSFGDVSAFVERIAPEDQKKAVVVETSGISPPDDETLRPEPVVSQLNQFTEVLLECLRSPDSAHHRLLRALQQAAGTVGAAMYAAQVGGAQEWASLAEVHAADDQVAPNPDALEWSRFTAVINGTRLLLLVRFTDEGAEPWQDALCRHAIALAAIFVRQPPAGRRQRQTEVVEIADPWPGIVGEAVRKHLSSCTEMCRYCDTVFLMGETGTGKELVARGLHRIWARRGSLVAINCAAIPSELLDAELFGIEAGTATGVSARRGRIEQAEGGTLFLDEVADLPTPLQTKLLRVLQEREYYSVGGKQLRRADVRIIAASNRTAGELRGGQMRADLYFRLSQATVVLPPLRERLADLPALCSYFLSQLERQFSRGISGLSVSALAALRNHGWPGNVRELQNVLRVVYASAPAGSVIRSAHLPAEIRSKPAPSASGKLDEVVEDAERSAIRLELERTGSVPRAARSLGVSEGYLYRKIKKLGLDSIRRPIR